MLNEEKGGGGGWGGGGGGGCEKESFPLGCEKVDVKLYVTFSDKISISMKKSGKIFIQKRVIKSVSKRE